MRLRLLPEKKSRPLLSKLDDVSLMEFIVEKLPERDVYYRQSKIIVRADQMRVPEVVKNILKNPLLNKKLKTST